ncbi:MAG: phage portal protein family protein, partial [Thermomicrobiales bacterium]
RPKNGDPRGTSILRPAYNVWQLKQQVFMEHLKYLAQFASPSLIGFTGPNAESRIQTDALGNPLTDANGNLLPALTPEQVMQQALAAFKNGTAAAFPYETKVQLVQSAGTGEAFLHAFDYYDRQIVSAILGQTLATEEGQHQARSAAQTHQDILDTIIRQAKRAVERALVRDILRPWLRYNYGDTLLPLLPRATLGTTEQQDIPTMRTSVAALVQAGYDLAPSQYPDLDKQLDLPARSAEDQARLEEQAAQPPPPPLTLPGQAPQLAPKQPPANKRQQPPKEEAA